MEFFGLGNHKCLRELEQSIARFLGTEDAVCFPMGFGTNSMNIPAFVEEVGALENILNF